MIIADTSGLLAYFNRAEPVHKEVADLIGRETDPLVISPYVLAELDYLVATRIGTNAELAVLSELTSGAYELAGFDAAAVALAATVISRYKDQNVGLADASLVVLADRFSTQTILTLDHRHFDVLRLVSGQPFTIVP